MAFTNRIILASVTALSLFFSHSAVAELYSGLATHDQNPLLIPYWIPHTLAPMGKSGVQISTAFFLTNTLHDETKSNETLIIDAETYRFDINLQYEVNQWLYHIQIPLISSNGGFMDNFIIKWHDAFSLPQGYRLNHNNDQLNLQYQVNNDSIIDTQQSYAGIGDISLAASHPFYRTKMATWAFGFGLNIPTGNNNELLSNQGIDSALWLSYLSDKKPIFLTLGIIKHANSGFLKTRLNSSVVFIQTGLEAPLSQDFNVMLQLDYHSKLIDSATDALGQSLQVQLGLNLINTQPYQLKLFFSEDILVGSAPDITFGLQLDWMH